MELMGSMGTYNWGFSEVAMETEIEREGARGTHALPPRINSVYLRKIMEPRTQTVMIPLVTVSERAIQDRSSTHTQDYINQKYGLNMTWFQ